MRKNVLSIVLLLIFGTSSICLAEMYKPLTEFNSPNGEESRKDIDFTIFKGGKGTIKKAPVQKLVSGYIVNDILHIYFTSSSPNATITISNKLTGAVEYTEICNSQSTVINLSVLSFEEESTYIIEVSTANWKRVGEFEY
jgi:hypothetical protein